MRTTVDIEEDVDGAARGIELRCTTRAVKFLPVPVSPVSKTVALGKPLIF